VYRHAQKEEVEEVIDNLAQFTHVNSRVGRREVEFIEFTELGTQRRHRVAARVNTTPRLDIRNPFEDELKKKQDPVGKATTHDGKYRIRIVVLRSPTKLIDRLIYEEDAKTLDAIMGWERTISVRFSTNG
jgi:hypothetical protein